MRTVFVTAVTALFFGGCSVNEESAEESGYSRADGYNGGRLYDRFWAVETGFDQSNIAFFEQHSEFFRCSQCHGWDLLGREGHLAGQALSANRPNVADVNLIGERTRPARELFDAIRTGISASRRDPAADLSTYDPVSNSIEGDRMPDYAGILTDDRIWDLVKFLKTEAVDVRELYDYSIAGSYPGAVVSYSNIGRDGEAEKGVATYTRECAECHGADGTSPVGFFYVGYHVRRMPYEDAHIFKFGVLGTDMTEEKLSVKQMKDLFKALADSTKYP